MLHASGTWQSYPAGSSGLAGGRVSAIAIDTAKGDRWFGTGAGASVLHASANWQTYDASNSGLASDLVSALAIDPTNGDRWFGTDHGASVLRSDGSWHLYDMSNSGLPENAVTAIAIDGTTGDRWFGTAGGASVLHVDGTWQTYNTANSGLASNDVAAIAIDPSAGNRWLATSGGASVMYGGPVYAITAGPAWINANSYSASYDFSTLVPLGTYSVTVAGAVGSDGIEIAPYSGVTFTVAYAGSITVHTPPPPPDVTARGNGSLTTIWAGWSDNDPSSPVDDYRYAIGTAPGGTDVASWTETAATSVTRSGLNLLAGEKYYVAVTARNGSGLWSTAGVSNDVIGGQATRLVYLPLIERSH